MKIFKNFFLLILFFGVYSCGYKVVSKLGLNYNIINIETSGNQRINYKIKNKLFFDNSKASKNKFNLVINTTKEKIIKNKNIKNEITSYNLIITTKISYGLVGKLDKGSFTIVQNGDYKVSDQRQNTLNSEKSLTATLTDNIVEKIKYKLNSLVNDS